MASTELSHSSDQVCRLSGNHDHVTNIHSVIQGQSDVPGKLTQAEISKTLDFCLNAFKETAPEDREAVLKKVEAIDAKNKGPGMANLTDEEQKVLNTIRARQMLRTEDILHINNFSADAIDGFAPNVKRGSLGFVKAVPVAEVNGHAKEEQQTAAPIKAY